MICRDRNRDTAMCKKSIVLTVKVIISVTHKANNVRKENKLIIQQAVKVCETSSEKDSIQ